MRQSAPTDMDLGDQPAAAMYLHLLRSGSRLLPSVRSELGLDTATARLAWRDLESLGLVRPCEEEAQYTLVNPEIALLALLDRLRASTEGHLVQLDQTRRAMSTIIDRVKPALARKTALVQIDTLGSRREREEALISLNASARLEVSSMHPGPLPPAEVLDASLDRDGELIARGVRVRAVYGQTVASSPRARRYLRRLRDTGAELRLAPQVPYDLMLVDHAAAIVVSNPDRLADPLLLLRGSQLMSSYRAAYEDVWQRSIPYSPGVEPPQSGGTLPDTERAVLALMANGLTDEQIARRLGISSRTVRRAVAAIMEYVGSESRFQAGALAVMRGLV